MNKTKTGIGYSELSDKIYLGKQDQKKRMWLGEKADITQDFLRCLFEYLPPGYSRTISDIKGEILFISVPLTEDGLKKGLKAFNKELEKIQSRSSIPSTKHT